MKRKIPREKSIFEQCQEKISKGIKHVIPLKGNIFMAIEPMNCFDKIYYVEKLENDIFCIATKIEKSLRIKTKNSKE